jgi:hypothetical protein
VSEAPAPRAAPRWLLALLTFGASALVVLLAAEILLRAAGRGPWEVSTLDRNEPRMHDPDPERGWRNRPGTYTIPPYAENGHVTTITILSDGRRRAGADRVDDRPGLLLVGGSYTRGNGLSDDETFAWKLQARLPALRIVNHGTGGYGTYQSLLTLERVLPGSDTAAVLYAFIDHHVVRNVAPPAWVDLLSRFSRRSQVAVPYATLDAGGALVRHPPERYPRWPLDDRLASVAFLERLVYYARGAGREAQARSVTESLLAEMRDLSARHGAGFAVVVLSAGPDARGWVLAALAAQGIRSADCARAVTPRLQVPGEGHPNARLTTIWARCIEDRLGGWLRERALENSAS